MSRSGYSDDWDGDGGVPLEFYRRAVDNAIAGKRGQKFFCDLLAALDGLPEKRLIADDLVAPTGEVCAIGAIGKARGIDMTKLDPEDAEGVGSTFNIAQALAREIVYENDERGERWRSVRCKRCHGWGAEVVRFRLRACDPCGGSGFRSVRVYETPEMRFERMRAWVSAQIMPEARA